MMPQILEVAHFIQQNGVTQMQVWGGGIKSSLDSQRPAPSQLLLQLIFQQKLAATAPDYIQLFCNGLHGESRECLPVVVGRKTPVDQLL